MSEDSVLKNWETGRLTRLRNGGRREIHLTSDQSVELIVKVTYPPQETAGPLTERSEYMAHQWSNLAMVCLTQHCDRVHSNDLFFIHCVASFPLTEGAMNRWNGNQCKDELRWRNQGIPCIGQM